MAYKYILELEYQIKQKERELDDLYKERKAAIDKNPFWKGFSEIQQQINNISVDIMILKSRKEK